MLPLGKPPESAQVLGSKCCACRVPGPTCLPLHNHRLIPGSPWPSVREKRSLGVPFTVVRSAVTGCSLPSLDKVVSSLQTKHALSPCLLGRHDLGRPAAALWELVIGDAMCLEEATVLFLLLRWLCSLSPRTRTLTLPQSLP